MNELLTNFGINWKLLLAQAANFLLLLFILKRYAYGPLLKMMKTRKDEIAKGIQFTKDGEKKLAEIGVLKEETLKRAHDESLGIVKKGEAAAEERKNEILRAAEQKTELIIEEARRRIREEEARMKEGVSAGAEELVRLAVTKVLGKIPVGVRDAPLIEEALEELKETAQKQ